MVLSDEVNEFKAFTFKAEMQEKEEAAHRGGRPPKDHPAFTTAIARVTLQYCPILLRYMHYRHKSAYA